MNGNKVYGQVEFSGPQTAQFKLLGTLDSRSAGPNPTEFLIEGNQLKGSSQGGASGQPLGHHSDEDQVASAAWSWLAAKGRRSRADIRPTRRQRPAPPSLLAR